MRYKIIKILAFFGVGLFFYILFKLDPLNIWNIIKKISWPGFLILLALRLGFFLIRTLNWKIVTTRYQLYIPFWHLFCARLSGHAVGFLTPSSKIGGEAFKVLMVESTSKKKVLASVVVDKTIELLATVFLVVIGITIALIQIPMPQVQKMVFIALTITIIVMGFFILKQQKKGLLIWLIELLKKVKLRFNFFENNREKIRETDGHISNFYSSHHRVFLIVFLFYLVMIFWWTGEIYLNFVTIGNEQITFLDCFLLITLGSFAYLLPGLPASLGIYEVTYLSLFALLGIPIEFGITLMIFRRLLGLLLAGIGLVPMIKLKKPLSSIPPKQKYNKN